MRAMRTGWLRGWIWTLLLMGSMATSHASAQTVRNIAARGACSTAGVEGLSAQLAEAQRCLDPSAFVRFAPHPNITLSSGRVHPYAQATTRDALHRAAASRALTINSAFRTVADQYVLYHSGGCGLAARPGRSNHQSGRAVDVGSYSTVRSTLQAQGCRWLGSSDPVHFDCPGTDRRADSVRAFQRLWNANNPGDTITEDGIYGTQTANRLASSPAGGFAQGACDTDPDPMPMPMEGRIRGVVYADGDPGRRVANAAVRLVGTSHSMTADTQGAWAFDVSAGEYTVEASAPGYTTGRHTCVVADGEVWCSVEVRTGMVSTDGTLRGQVTDRASGAGLAGAQVLLSDDGTRTSTSADGSWSLTLPAGTYTLIASAEGYAPLTVSCSVSAGTEAGCSLSLAAEASTVRLLGVAFADGDTSQRVVGARVELLGDGAFTTSREGDGLFSFDVLPGTYTVRATGAGFEPAMRECVVDGETWCSVSMRSDGSTGGLVIEEAGNDHGTVAPPEDLEEARRATVAPPGCAAGGTQVGGWLLLWGLALWIRRRSAL